MRAVTTAATSREWRWQAVAVSVAVVTAVVGAHVADRVVRPSPCRAAADFGPAQGYWAAGGEWAAGDLLRLKSVGWEAELISPVPVPHYQLLRPGQAARWEIAVLQVPDRARTLYADFGDGRTRSLADVPAGSGACVFEASRPFDHVGPHHVVQFALLDASVEARPTVGAGLAPFRIGQAVVDVVDGRS